MHTSVIFTQSRVLNSVIFNVHLQYLFKVEPQLEIVVMELASETPLVAVLRLPIDDLEGDVFIGRVYHYLHDAVLAPLHQQQLEHGRGALVIIWTTRHKVL